MSRFPKLSDWTEDVYSAGARGFNPLRDFEPAMHKAYPDTRPYKFGFFSSDGVPERSTMGWVHLHGGDFEVEDFNAAVGLRFGLTVDASDRVKHGDNFVMIMSRQWRDDVLHVQEKKEIDRLEELAEDKQTFVHPADPEFNKMKDRARELASTEKYKLQIEGTPDHGEPPEKRKPGRPKKSD